MNGSSFQSPLGGLSDPCSHRPAPSPKHRYEQVAFQSLVKTQFERVGTEVARVHGSERWRQVDAGGSVDEVRQKIGALVDIRTSPSREGGAKGKLWTEEKGV